MEKKNGFFTRLFSRRQLINKDNIEMLLDKIEERNIKKKAELWINRYLLIF
ncbi:MAG: hypothetical protein ABIG64_09535 [Candidatus Omnitrophota bacterium]